MRVDYNIIRHAKAAYARLRSIRRNAPQRSPTFVGDINIPLTIYCRTDRSRNAGCQQLQAFAIQAQAVDVTCRTIRHNDAVGAGIPGDTINTMLTLCLAWYSWDCT